MFSKVTILSALGAATLARADLLPLPEVNPPLNSEAMESYMVANMPVAEYTKTYWEDSSLIPENCKNFAINNYNVDPNDFTVFDVQYNDCDTAWTFCRHKDAQNDEDHMIEVVGRQPVHVRQYINLVMAVPQIGDDSGIVAETWSSGECVLGAPSNTKVITHEFSHSVDGHADTDQDKPFSNSPKWQDAYNSDRATPTEYGRSSWAEDFAEMGMFAAYEKAGGSLDDLTTSWPDLGGQLTAIHSNFPQYVPGGTCDLRLDNAAAVPKSEAAARIKAPKKLDTSIKNSKIQVIKVDFSKRTSYGHNKNTN